MSKTPQQKAMAALMYVSLVKFTDTVHALADQLRNYTGEDFSKIALLHEQIEKSLERNLQHYAEHDDISMESIEALNRRIVELKSKLRG